MEGNFDDWVNEGCPDEPGEGRTQKRPAKSQLAVEASQVRKGNITKITDGSQFANFDGKDGAGVALMTTTSKGQKQPKGTSGRASELAGKMLPLRSIEPVLSSRYLVKGWLDRGAFSVVYGESNVGKTFFALDLAIHVAAAKNWHGHKVPCKQNYAGPVVFVACEGGTSLSSRIEAIRRNNPALVEAAESEFMLLPTELDLCGTNDATALINAIEDCCSGPSLIVIDTLAMAFGGGDENTAKDMGLFITNCIRLRTETGAHVMVIHHSGKDKSKGARGSGSLRAAADTEIELTRSGTVIMASDRKQRDKQAGKEFAYTLRSVMLGNDEDGDAVTSAVIEQVEPVKRIPRIARQPGIALQALDETLADHGETKSGEPFPSTCLCVSLDKWRECCNSHELTKGKCDSAARTAFGRAVETLKEKKFVRVVDGFAWKCANE